MTVDRAHWLQLVESRVERYAELRDPALVLDDAAVTEVEQLLELAGDPPDTEAAIAAGWLHWYRADLTTDEHSQFEVETAVRLFTPVFDVFPDYVPTTLRDLLSDQASAYNGAAALNHYLATGDDASLARAVELLRAEAGNDSDPRVSSHHANLSVALRQAFLAHGDPGVLDEAIESGERGLTDEPGSGATRAVLAAAYLTRFDHTGQQADLDEAVALFDAAVADEDDPAATNAVVLGNRAAALITRYENRTEVEDVTAAVDSARRALAHATDDGERGVAGSVLGQALRNHYDATGDRPLLDEAITEGRRAVDLGRTAGLDVSDALSNLAAALSVRHGADGHLVDLDEAVIAAQEAARTADQENRATYLSNLADLLHTRFERTRNQRDLNDALELSETAVATTSDTSPRLPSYLTTRALLLHERHTLTGSPSDLDDAVATSRRAVDLLGGGHIERLRALSLLSVTLETRYETTGARRDLDDAITAADTAANGRGPNRATYLNNLASALKTRFSATADPADLDRAIDVGRQAMLAAPHAGDRAQYASHLSAVLVSRFQFHGYTTDLTAAVEAARDAMAATEPDDPARPSREANLSAVLHTRFEHLGELSDLEAALRSARRALDLAPEGPRRAVYLSTVGAVLLGRYDHVDDPADLDEAIAVFRAAIDHTSANAPDLAGRWTNLGYAMLKRAATADPPDLGPAIEACRNAVSAIRPDSPEYGAIHANLAGVLIEAYLHHPDPAFLPEAADHARTAVRATPPGTPDAALFLTHLGIALAQLGTTSGEDGLTTALSCLDEAARISTAAPIIRMHAARWHGHYAALAGWGAEAQTGYAAAVGLLDRASWRGLARRSRERHLASVQGLASGAGAWSLHNGQPERAVELLEQGRSVLWTQLLDSPGNHSELSRVAPDLAARLAEIGRELNHSPDLGTTALPLGQWP